MIAYDKNLLKNTFLVTEAKALEKARFITKEQFQNAVKALPALKSQHNILIRSGFFILGVFLYSSVSGVLALFGLVNVDLAIGLVYLFAAIGLVGSELLARQKYYGFGLDDAFILGTQFALGIAVTFSTEGNILVITGTVTIAALIMYLRYVHLPSMVVFFLALTATLAYAVFDLLAYGKAILPFAMMLFAVGMYVAGVQLLKKLTEPFYYNGILLIRNFSLVLFYLSGNYFVVRELSAAMADTYYDYSPEIPLSWFFWCFTFIIPVLYIVFALQNKNRMLLWIGFLAFCFSIFSFRNYHHVLPTEFALTLGGLFLFAFTYFSIKKIKNNATGFTFKPDRFDNSNALLNVETLIIASTFDLKPAIKAEESPMEFGDGGFSGGGSGGSF